MSPDECSRLAVGFAAVLDGGDVEGVAVVVEAEPVIADAQSELGWLDVLDRADGGTWTGQIGGQADRGT